jgi:phosphohistidine phosphatase
MEQKRIYLVQHGEAVSEEKDPSRPLTEKGRRDSAKTAQFLKASGIKVDVIWHSTKLRAVETARIFADILLPNDGVEEKEGLAPMDAPNAIFIALTLAKKNIMLVGHLPFLQKLISLILFNTDNYDIVKFNMGGVIALEQTEEGRWKIVFEIISDLLP